MQHDMSEVLRLPREMTMEVSKVLRLPRDMQLIFGKPCKSTAPATHLLRNIFANSDVECILRAKTLQLNLTGAIE